MHLVRPLLFCTNMQQSTTHLPTGNHQAILMLEDGNVFYGKAFGKIGTASGEICFNTGMTGYQEVFTEIGRAHV